MPKPHAKVVREVGGAGVVRFGIAVSSQTGDGMDALRAEIVRMARLLLPGDGALALNARHRAILWDAKEEIAAAAKTADPILVAEHLRCALDALDRLSGRAGVEDMLDMLFGRFCIGK